MVQGREPEEQRSNLFSRLFDQGRENLESLGDLLTLPEPTETQQRTALQREQLETQRIAGVPPIPDGTDPIAAESVGNPFLFPQNVERRGFNELIDSEYSLDAETIREEIHYIDNVKLPELLVRKATLISQNRGDELGEGIRRFIPVPGTGTNLGNLTGNLFNDTNTLVRNHQISALDTEIAELATRSKRNKSRLELFIEVPKALPQIQLSLNQRTTPTFEQLIESFTPAELGITDLADPEDYLLIKTIYSRALDPFDFAVPLVTPFDTQEQIARSLTPTANPLASGIITLTEENYAQVVREQWGFDHS